MKRRLNVSVWIGFLVVLTALFTYFPVFVRLQATRDSPWATLLIFGVGLALIARGLKQAYLEPQLYRGKVAGPILATLGIALIALFCFGILYAARQLPPSRGAPQVGDRAPDFTLPDKDGREVTLSALLGGGADRLDGVVLIFYRGYW